MHDVCFSSCFQYPQSDRGRCNVVKVIHPKRRSPTFSILSRIVGAATFSACRTSQSTPSLSVSSVGSWALQLAALRAKVISQVHFQYPQSDRGRCNVVPVSVVVTAGVPFSILSRIVGAATGRLGGHRVQRNGLSVSSVGSWALQPRYHLAQLLARPRLSVSSVGSWALQLPLWSWAVAAEVAFSILSRIVGAATRVRGLSRVLPVPPFSILSRIVGAATFPTWARSPSLILAFSILSRIVGAATTPTPLPSQLSAVFQYPQSDRGRCNLPRQEGPTVIVISFQYPQSDRGRCNPQRYRLGSFGYRSFSILSRIVGAATSPTTTFPVAEDRLSVSSVGSWALQRAHWIPSTYSVAALSVSSVGSWALQLRPSSWW